MPSITYYGSFGENSAGADGLSAWVDKGTALPANAVITDIDYTLDISADNYSSSKYWELHWFAIGDPDGSPYANEKSKAMSGTDYTFSGSMVFSQSDVDVFTSGSFEVYAKANTTHSSRSYMGDFSITVEYTEDDGGGEEEEITDCWWAYQATFECSPTLTSEKTTLSWTGANGGDGNDIVSYEIQYAKSTDGSTWGNWKALTTVTSTKESGSKSVTVTSYADYGEYLKFRICIHGEAGSTYCSAWKTSSNTVRRDHAPLTGFTDSTLTAGSTLIKAIHMTELQNRVNTLRTFYGLSAYGFTTITAGTTKLSGWTAHVGEMRTAIDQVCTASGKSHETWINFTVNCPRADVIQQLRNVVLAL